LYRQLRAGGVLMLFTGQINLVIVSGRIPET